MELTLFRKENTENGMVEEVGTEYVNLLISFFIDKKKINQSERVKLSNFCQRVYERDWWVKCGCQGSNGSPFFRFNEGSSGRLYLRRITTRGPHAIDCPFKESPMDAPSNSRSTQPLRFKKGPVSSMPYRSSGIRASKESTSKPNQSNKPSCSRNSKLAKLMYTVLDSSSANKATFTEKNYCPVGKKIFSAASNIEFVPRKKLINYLNLNIQKLPDLDEKLKHDQSWPANAIKHGFVLVKVKEFEGNKLTCFVKGADEETIHIENRVNVSSGRFGERTGPYMALIMVTDTIENPNEYTPYNAYIQPCYNEKLYFPVDSFYERAVLKKLYALGFRLQKNGLSMEIKKPLFDIPVYEGKEEYFFLPDFIVSCGGKRIILEVNGSHETDYLERKERTHTLMSKLGALLSIDAYGEELKGQLEPSISQLCSKIESIFTS